MIGVGGGLWNPVIRPLSVLGVSISFGSPLSIGSNASSGAVIAQASVSGQDGSHTYTLNNDASGQFAITSGGELVVGLTSLLPGNNTIIVTADNGTDAPIVKVFNVVVADVTTSPVIMQSSVTDPITGHVYSFVASDGVTAEARETFQYQDDTWGVKGTVENPVRIGSITPVSTSVSTAAYGVPDNLDDTATVGAQTRWLHGAMLNPWQGVGPGQASKTGFDNYYATSAPSGSCSYLHSLNIDPGAAGVMTLEEGSIVKSESLTEEGDHGANPQQNKTRVLKFSCLTVAPEIPAANSFRPGIRQLDKRSIATTDQLDIAGTRLSIAGLDQYDQADVDAAFDKIKHIQNTFMPFQEQALRWNPGLRGHGVGIYGDDWYGHFGRVFASFHSANFTDADLEPIIKATIQVGLDIYGLMQDGSHYAPWQAHHAGRKGIVMMAGLLLNNADILEQCDANLYPEHFGVDDAYCGYVTQNMVGVRGDFYKGIHPYEWEDEHVGIPEWSGAFTGGGIPTAPDGVDQIADPDLPRRAYQVLSFDNGAMYQCLWGMIMDPTARYYKPAYFDFADRYLGVRFGDQIDRVWDASSNSTGTNGHFTGNWHSINPLDEAVANMKRMRDACSRANYITQLPPEALPKPAVTHDGVSGYLDINFNTNNFRMPQDKDVAITGYDLRWTAYAGGADAAVSADADNWIGNYEWNVIENVTIPYQLSGVPRGLKAKIQLRMKNANGSGPWMDGRFQENYNENNQWSVLENVDRYSTNFDVPDIAAFNQLPLNFGSPSATTDGAVITGAIATGDVGIWSENPAITNTEWQWQVSDDGLTGWTDISGATASTFTTSSAQEGKYIRPGVRRTNSVGSSAYVYGETGTAVVAPVAVVGAMQVHGEGAFDPQLGALGGKKLLILGSDFQSGLENDDMTIGAYSFGAGEVIVEDDDAGGGQSRYKSTAWIVDVPNGETATTINYTHTSSGSCSVAFELNVPLQFLEAEFNEAGYTLSVATVNGGMAVFWARQSSVDFTSSPTLTEHPSNASISNFEVAYDLGTGDGDATVQYTASAASNLASALISLEPVI